MIKFSFYRIPLSRINPLASRGYHTIAQHLMKFDKAIPFYVIVTPGFWVVVNQEHRIPLSIFLMSSLFDCILLKHLAIMCRGLHWHLTSPSVNWIPRENYHTCPSMICVIIGNLL